MFSRLRWFALMLMLPLQGCLVYSQFDEPKPKYYAVITAAEVGLALSGGAMAAYGDSSASSRSPDEAPPPFLLTSLEVLVSFVAIDAIMFGISKALD